MDRAYQFLILVSITTNTGKPGEKLYKYIRGTINESNERALIYRKVPKFHVNEFGTEVPMSEPIWHASVIF